jgi:drug/metabolite transporter (DMT)-like permease
LCIGFAGIYILVNPSGKLSGFAFNIAGVSALLIACVSWSIGSVYSKSAELPASSIMATGAEMLMGSLGLLVMSLLTNEWQGWSIAAVSMNSTWALLYLIFIGSMIGFVSYIWLLKHAPISLVATYAYVNPVVAVLLGSWIAHEPLGAHIWLAAAIIIGSVMLVNSRNKTASAE